MSMLRAPSFTPQRHRSACRARTRHGAAFTLLETAFSTVIIGVGVLAVVEAQQSFLQRNAWSTSASTASYLAGEIRELASRFTRHDVDSDGIYYQNPSDPTTFAGWGREVDELDAEDLDDLDDLDGAVFGDVTDLPDDFTMVRRYAGPINSFADVIPEISYEGNVVTAAPVGGGEPVPVNMRGWSQIVDVVKVDPEDFADAVADNSQIISGGEVVRNVDRYPVRVTVRSLYQPSPAEPAEVIASLTWVVTP